MVEVGDQVDGQQDGHPTGTDALVEALQARIADQTREIGELHRLLALPTLNAAPTRPWWRFWQ